MSETGNSIRKGKVELFKTSIRLGSHGSGSLVEALEEQTFHNFFVIPMTSLLPPLPDPLSSTIALLGSSTSLTHRGMGDVIFMAAACPATELMH